MSELDRRVLSSLDALAVGDALSKQTETFTRDAVREWYPEGVTGFHGSPGDIIPRYRG